MVLEKGKFEGFCCSELLPTSFLFVNIGIIPESFLKRIERVLSLPNSPSLCINMLISLLLIVSFNISYLSSSFEG